MRRLNWKRAGCAARWGRAAEPSRGWLAANAAGYQPAWGNLQAGQLLQLTGWTVPVLTVAGDQAKTAAEQLPCYVAAFFLATPEPVKAGGALAAARNGGSEQGRLAHAALRARAPAPGVERPVGRQWRRGRF
ncbi:hypothetical protein JOS77_23015 [Chromobacterium haemolyticum]|nr:hypothetical protein JOS77_23015 [Chromobacterium haemolyticum]